MSEKTRTTGIACINGVGIIVDKGLKGDVVSVNRISDRIILIKLVLGPSVINIISDYTPHVGLDESEKVGSIWTIPFGVYPKTNKSL